MWISSLPLSSAHSKWRQKVENNNQQLISRKINMCKLAMGSGILFCHLLCDYNSNIQSQNPLHKSDKLLPDSIGWFASCCRRYVVFLRLLLSSHKDDDFQLSIRSMNTLLDSECQSLSPNAFMFVVSFIQRLTMQTAQMRHRNIGLSNINVQLLRFFWFVSLL